MKRLFGVLAALMVMSSVTVASATGFTDLGGDIGPRQNTEIKLEGVLRLRASALHNLDLDRGPTPSGELLFPIPLSDSTGQTLTHADMRMRWDLSVFAPGESVAVRLRVDMLDNVALGSTPVSDPASSTTQVSPGSAIRVKRAYGEALAPIGLLVAGRTGNQWGLGMLANGGDCADCDSGDAADRVSFVTPLLGHIWAAAYDWSAVGPVTLRRGGDRTVDIEPSDDVRTLTFAVLNWRDDAAHNRAKRGGRWMFEYGAYVSHQWQDKDIPAGYLSLANPVEGLTPTDVVSRGYQATAVDGWMRLTGPWLRVETEIAGITSKVDQVSLVPGVLLPEGATSTQFGAALESMVGAAEDPVLWGLDAGFASGDSAPGFGALQGLQSSAPVPGDLDGPQASPPRDNTINNFRFHRDYRIDRILFREIIGTVTDAVYVRPHVQWRIHDFGAGELRLSLAGVLSRAVETSSTPGGDAWLGFELDPTLSYRSRDGFSVALEHAILFPMAGLDNPDLRLVAKEAQIGRLRVMYMF